MTEPATGAARDDRRSFLRCRRHALLGGALTAGGLGVLAAVFLAPNRLASLELGDVALAWWGAGILSLGAVVTVVWGFRGVGATGVGAGTSRFAPFALAAVWSSPALWLGLPPLLLADGIRGLWAPIVIAAGVAVTLLFLGLPWNRTGGLTASASTLARTRWPAARGCHVWLGSLEAIVAALFVWAQLAAAREVGATVGWPRGAIALATALVVVALLFPDLARVRLTGAAAGLALAGVAVPLVVIAVGTTTAWPFVWSAVASRARIAFGEGSRWTAPAGATVRGPASPLVLRFSDEQRVTFAGRGSVIVVPREGGRIERDGVAGDEIALHPGDQLIVPGGFPLRFEAGRRVPNAPDSGPEWMEPPSRSTGLLWLVALAVTGCLGTLGLPTGDVAVGTGRLTPGRGAALASLVVTCGMLLAVGWSLYAAWLTPEVYVGGVTGAEVYTLASAMPGSGASVWLTGIALGGLALGAAASALAALRGAPTVRRDTIVGGRHRVALALVVGAGVLAGVVPLGSGVVLLLALGLAAAALGPAAVLACWSERATPQGTASGAGAGALTFLLLAGAVVSVRGSLSEGWGSLDVAAPAALAALIHVVGAWLLRSRGIASPRRPLPPGLERLPDGFPARSRAG